MRPPDTLRLDGRAYSWRALTALRRAQIAAWRAAQPEQPALFALHDDRRPAAGRSASGRHAEPGLFD
jgi:hypothetical protein